MEPGISILFDMWEEFLYEESLSGGVHHILLGVLRKGWSDRRILGEERTHSCT